MVKDLRVAFWDQKGFVGPLTYFFGRAKNDLIINILKYIQR